MVADGPNLLTVEEAAKLFRVHVATIRRWVRLKKLPALKVGGGSIRIYPPRAESWGASPSSDNVAGS
jgi:excisionase family DNA binding protein